MAHQGAYSSASADIFALKISCIPPYIIYGITRYIPHLRACFAACLLKMKAVSLLLVCALPGVVLSLSCSQIVSRTQTIEDSFCGEYSSSDVYTARVVGATCNCIPASGDANLQCQDYTFSTGNTSVVNVEVVNRVMCRVSFGGAPRCTGLATSLVDSGKTWKLPLTPN